MFFGTKSHHTILSNYVTIFKVDAEIWKNPRKIPLIDFNGSEIIDIVILARN